VNGLLESSASRYAIEHLGALWTHREEGATVVVHAGLQSPLRNFPFLLLVVYEMWPEVIVSHNSFR
jgi:hypothetical protein